MKPVQGLTLGDRYRLEQQLAVGGMGEVWVARDDALAREVAVKVLREEFAGDSGFLARFRVEARNSASLSHPNIAQLYDYGEQDGSAYLVMELVEGEPMSDLLEREPVLPARTVLPILAQTARALEAAHRAGLVHRDVKPGNILLDRAGRVKITDFGVSRAADQAPLTATGMVMGTAQYLSPEQAVGRPATPASDLYSLGIVAFESLVGRRPFTGPSAVDIAISHVNDPVPPLPRQLDPALAALVLALLAKEPADRPGSARELAESFDALVPRTPPSGVPAVAPAPAPPSSGGRPTTPPPSYPPGGRAAGSRASAAPAATRGRATTGRRFGRLGRLTWPLLALLLLLIALLGAKLADTLMGPNPGTESSTTVDTTSFHPREQSLEPAAIGGMITARVPTGPPVVAGTTTAKDA
ncbi:protein kinase domain-containing protein [Pengzhenrongella sicca]|uniref:non-specific serine/threonine protein kinase n=1 Tax=Pengzhenrongella sicca TaxID=2819238 RepID=A0A8A4ZF32_9MICO|nr:protein kinase [Pengzhenrongella sicca]QTE29523.1 serine/threonine protein kinase [Pengzhenrongella sicca]